MAGEAKTNSFTLGSATVMIGKLAQLWDLTPAANSIGLVKNFTISSTPTFLDLNQGSKGEIIYSALTSNALKASMEVFEYTSQNLAYGLGLDGSTLVAQVPYPLAADAIGNSSPVTSATFIAATSQVSLFPIGQWVMFQDGTSDHVHYAQLTGTTTTSGTAPTISHTLTFANQGLKAGNSFLMIAASTVAAVNRMDIGSPEDQQYYSCKVVAIMPEGDKPIGVLLPKVRIIRGFNAMFATDHYGNMPFEMQPLSLIPSDVNYTTFQGKGAGMLMATT